MYLGRIVEETPVSAVDHETWHPYTRALLSATPSLLHDVTAIELHGPIPSAVHPPSGCPFRTRCWRATEQCTQTMPDFDVVPDSSGHRYRCFHPVRSESDLAGATAQELP